MPTQFHPVELPSGLRVEVRAQSWPEFRAEMDARVNILETLAGASGEERARAELALSMLEWRSRRDKIAACLRDPQKQELMTSADAVALARRIDALGSEELETKNLKSGGAGSTTRDEQHTAPAV